jgi:hypothetical protein
VLLRDAGSGSVLPVADLCQLDGYSAGPHIQEGCEGGARAYSMQAAKGAVRPIVIIMLIITRFQSEVST